MNSNEVKSFLTNADNKSNDEIYQIKNPLNVEQDDIFANINLNDIDLVAINEELLTQINQIDGIINHTNIPKITKTMLNDINETLRGIYDISKVNENDTYTMIHLNLWFMMQPTIRNIVKNVIQLSKNREGEKLLKSVTDASKLANIESIPSATIKRAEVIEYPLDKINSKIWSLFDHNAKKVAFAAEKRGSKKELNIYYSIDFDDLGEGISITKKLQPFDKRVYIAISALFNAGNKIITLTQIYYAIGNTGRPSSASLSKINNSITKMMGAKIYVNNEQEAATYRYNKFVYDGSLLPIERSTAIVNGQLAESAIHIFREPPVISFAKQRSQITTLELKVLKSPISKTDLNLLIDDYLIERISKAKNGKSHHRILYKTLYEKAGITSKKQKERTPDKVRRYLDHYQKCGMISRYTMGKDGVSVYFN